MALKEVRSLPCGLKLKMLDFGDSREYFLCDEHGNEKLIWVPEVVHYTALLAAISAESEFKYNEKFKVEE